MLFAPRTTAEPWGGKNLLRCSSECAVSRKKKKKTFCDNNKLSRKEYLPCVWPGLHHNQEARCVFCSVLVHPQVQDDRDCHRLVDRSNHFTTPARGRGRFLRSRSHKSGLVYPFDDVLGQAAGRKKDLPLIHHIVGRSKAKASSPTPMPPWTAKPSSMRTVGVSNRLTTGSTAAGGAHTSSLASSDGLQVVKRL